MEKVIRYQSEPTGELFETEEDCLRDEAAYELTELLEGVLPTRDACAGDVVDTITRPRTAAVVIRLLERFIEKEEQQ